MKARACYSFWHSPPPSVGTKARVITGTYFFAIQLAKHWFISTGVAGWIVKIGEDSCIQEIESYKPSNEDKVKLVQARLS